jgi:putative transposase
MSHVATTEGIKGEDVRDLTAVEHRFGRVNQCPRPSNGSPTTAWATLPTRPGALPATSGWSRATTPIESPQSNGMTEAFVRTIKRDYVSVSSLTDAATVWRHLPFWLEHYNTVHPHRALGYRSPREFITHAQPLGGGRVRNLGGLQQSLTAERSIGNFVCWL